ncbi:ABC transporter permease [Bacteroidota bacterium]
MIHNFLITTWRFFLRNKTYSLINILGLSLGMAVCMIIYSYIRYELSFDKFHKYSDRIYRISCDPFASLAPSFVPLLKQDYNEIEKIARMAATGTTQVQIEEDSYSETGSFFAEPEIFEIFDLSLIKGNRETALKDPNSVVLSRTLAMKYFDTIDILGKQILIDNDWLFQITGVFNDLPENSHIQCNLLASYETLRGVNGSGEDDYFHGSGNFSDNVTHVYLRLSENADSKKLRSSLPSFVDRHLDTREDKSEGRPPSDYRRLDLDEVTDIHLYSNKMAELKANGDIRYVRIFSIVGIFILLIACVNFINLSTAKASKRAKEVGLKKVIGASNRTLISQFFLESTFYTFVSSILAFGMVQLSTPYLIRSLEVQASFNAFDSSGGVLAFLVILILTAVLAGIYPSIYLSAFKPLLVMRGEVSKGRKGALLRRILVVFQFTISISLIFSVMIVFHQMNFIQKTKLGYDKENVLILPANYQVINRWDAVRKDLESNSEITSACISKRTPGGELLDNPDFTIEVKGEVLERPFSMAHNRVDFGFFETFGMEMVAGRSFDNMIASDSLEAFVLNETAVQELGLQRPEEVLGLPIEAGNRKGNIIGVVKDFNYESLHKKIRPILTYIVPGQANTIAVKLAEGNLNERIDLVRSIMSKWYPGYAFDYTFLDENLNKLYINEARMYKLFQYFSLLAVLIAIIGLFGLSMFNIESKTKEIGIRKVNGASIRDIVVLLAKTFTIWVIFAFILGSPLTHIIMNKWLENFAYKISIPWWFYGVTLLSILFVAWFTISWQSIKAAVRNPVETLRYE